MSCEQRTKPITSAKRRGWNGHRFLCVPHRSWGFNVCNKMRRTCVIIKSHRFLCHPYRSWEFHDGIKYQCPGVTVPKCRRFWRALMCVYFFCAGCICWSNVLDIFNEQLEHIVHQHATKKRDTKSLHFSMMIGRYSRAKEELLCFMSDINIDMVWSCVFFGAAAIYVRHSIEQSRSPLPKAQKTIKVGTLSYKKNNVFKATIHFLS